MSIFFILFLFISFFPLLGVGIPIDDCTPTRCKHGPMIQFPFRFKNQQPDYCGYPGFDVSCDEKGETVVVLPSSLTLTVKKINYELQQVQLYDPQNCLPGKLPNLNLSASVFNFAEEMLNNYTLFNCSSPKQDYDDQEILCLSDSSYKMYFIGSSVYMDSYPLTSCTRFQNVSSVPWAIFHEKDLLLIWSKPDCGQCEAQGKGCSFRNVTGGNQTQCIFKENKNKGSAKNMIAGVALSSFVVVMTAAVAIVVCIKIIRERENQKKVEKFLEDYRGLKPTRFCYSDIRRITNEFSEKLGEGGYGVVYKGKLSREISVAVKVLNNSKEKGEEFVNEVSTIGRIHHVNVVRLVGFCAEGFRRVVVYEYLPNESLEKFIFQRDEESKRSTLGWEKLEEIAMGIAKGIEYLHQGCDQQILHFDIKPHNILLDQNLNPKVCDFGLAKLCSKEQSGVTMTAARGTMGYIAPEVLSRTFGKVSYKSDVYSFGMLLLEMVGGRKNVDPKVMNTSQVYFPQWIYSHLNLGDELWLWAQNQEDGNDIARKLTIVALTCIQWNPTDRPSMKLVVQMLEGDGSDLAMPPNPFPDGNLPSHIVAGMPERHNYQSELPLILEVDDE